MGAKAKKYSSWAEAAKVADAAAAELAERRGAAPPQKPRPAAPPLPPAEHLAMLRRVLAKQRARRVATAGSVPIPKTPTGC